MDLIESMPFKARSLRATIYGGPFRNFIPGTRRLVGVKMAVELNLVHDISVPTRDFDVPDTVTLTQGMIKAVRAMADGNDIYVGCMGGTGRTGVFMACMAKVMIDLGEGLKVPGSKKDTLDPVAYVRGTYRKHAVETPAQESFCRTFDTKEVVSELLRLQFATVAGSAELFAANETLRDDLAEAKGAFEGTLAALQATENLLGLRTRDAVALADRIDAFEGADLMARMWAAWLGKMPT